MRRMGIVFCDRCSSSIAEPEIERGRAKFEGERIYCESCLEWMRGREIGAEVHFCDRCNVSISVTEIRDGDATFSEGRLLCPRCAQGSGHAVAPGHSPMRTPIPPPRPVRSSPSRRVGPARIVISVAFVVVAGVAIVGALVAPERLAFWRHSSGGNAVEVGKGADPGVSSEAGDLAVAAEQAGSDPRLDAMTDSLRVVGERLDSIERRLDEVAASKGSSDASSVAARIGELEDSVAGLRQGANADLARLETALEGLRGDLARLDAKWVALFEASRREEEAAGRGAESPAEGGAAASDAGETDAEDAANSRATILEGLTAPEAGRRFSALVELGREASPEDVPVIARVLLEDEDLVVRELAANLLGKLGDPAAVEPLVRSLRDPAVSVVLAADDALTRITKRSSGLKRRATANARAEAVRKWEEWWKRNEDSYR